MSTLELSPGLVVLRAHMAPELIHMNTELNRDLSLNHINIDHSEWTVVGYLWSHVVSKNSSGGVVQMK